MALGAQTPTQSGPLLDLGQAFLGIFSVVIGAGDYATGGIVVNLLTLGGVKSTGPVQGVVGCRSTNGNLVDYVPGTTLANGKIKFFSGAATELAASAMAAGYVADVVKLKLILPKF